MRFKASANYKKHNYNSDFKTFQKNELYKYFYVIMLVIILNFCFTTPTVYTVYTVLLSFILEN